MRVTSDLWVSALMRRVFAAGGYAAVLRRGATEAGAIFVLSRDRLAGVTLYGPAPQASYDAGKPDDRYFTLVAENDEQLADKHIERELRFDPDIWLVEIEGGNATELMRIVQP